MNRILLHGKINNIEYSHNIQDVEYEKATLEVADSDSVIPLRFKKKSNTYNNGDDIKLIGNIRSYSEKLNDKKNKVEIYVFTYLDKVDFAENNYVELDGRICKTDKVRYDRDGNKSYHMIIANNIISTSGKQKLNNYLPIVAKDDLADTVAEFNVSDRVVVKGVLQSRKYIKITNGVEEERVAMEVIADEICKL